MAFFFNRTRSRPPIEIVRSAKESLSKLWEGPIAAQRVGEELAKQLAQMKFIVQGTQETDSSPEQVDQLIHAMIQEDVLYLLARSIHLLPFEARKDAQTIFSHALRFNKSPDPDRPSLPALTYATETRPEVIVELCRGYRHSQSALPCGSILREALKHKLVAGVILYDQSKDSQRAVRLGEVDVEERQSGEGVFWEFFGWINQSAFEVSADAFTTFREILTKHKSLVAHYLTRNFDLFFSRYNTVLMQSESYVTKRQSIKLLGEILLDRANYNVMTAYVDRGEHLKLCMNLLKDDRKMVQYEGFHVFKVFVANPNKSVAVQRILINNRERLLKFLPKFLEDRTEDDQFTDEKSFLVRQIELLPPEPVEPTKPGAVNGNSVGVAAAS